MDTVFLKKSLARAVILGVCSLMAMSSIAAECKDQSNTKTTADTSKYVVSVSKVTSATIPITIPALGSLTAPNIVSISSDVDARVSSIHFSNGQNVTKGMPIISLDSAQVEADYNTAVTDYNLKKLKYDRYNALGTDAVSGQDLAEYKADVDNAKQEVKNKQAILNQYTISAPFDGQLGAFNTNEGDYVAAGTTLVTLVDTKQLQADYTVPEVYFPKLKQGQSATIKVNAYPDDSFFGTVTYISPTVDESTRTVSVQSLISNDDGRLSPGMFVKLTQKLAEKTGALVIPDQAVSADIKGYYVFLVNGNQVVQTYIKIGTRQSGTVEVLDGLKLGDVIVSAGQQKLDDGSYITIAKSTAADDKSKTTDKSSTTEKTTGSDDRVSNQSNETSLK